MSIRLRRVVPLSVAAALVIALVTAIAPTPAYAADTLRQEIILVGDGRLRADVMWGSTEPFTGVFLWTNNYGEAQEFDLLDSGSGFFRIRARHSNQCLMLDWRGGSNVNGVPIIQYPHCEAGYAPAEWYIRWVEIPASGIWAAQWKQTIVNRHTGRCLDAAAPSGQPAQQARLQQWDCITSGDQWNANNQMWAIRSPIGPIH